VSNNKISSHIKFLNMCYVDDMNTRMMESNIAAVRELCFTKQNKCHLTYNTAGLQNLHQNNITFDTFGRHTGNLYNPVNVICIGYKQNLHLTTIPVINSDVCYCQLCINRSLLVCLRKRGAI
jgi:hypothetical protein